MTNTPRIIIVVMGVTGVGKARSSGTRRERRSLLGMDWSLVSAHKISALAKSLGTQALLSRKFFKFQVQRYTLSIHLDLMTRTKRPNHTRGYFGLFNGLLQ